MIRKFVLAAAAVAALGTVSLAASTPAAAGARAGVPSPSRSMAAASASPRVSGYRFLLAQRLGREPLRRARAPHVQRLLLSRTPFEK